MSEVVIVTGSSSGIGRAVAERFAGDGARVIVNSSRSVEEGELLARSLPEAVYVQGDLSREEDAKRLVATALERFGRLDVVVNNAGTTRRVPFADLDGADDEMWQRILGVNLMGPWYLSRAAVPALREAKGAIVNVGSVAGIIAGWELAAVRGLEGGAASPDAHDCAGAGSRRTSQRGRARAGRDAVDSRMGGERSDRRPDTPWSRGDARRHRGRCRLTRSHAVRDGAGRRRRRRADPHVRSRSGPALDPAAVWLLVNVELSRRRQGRLPAIPAPPGSARLLGHRGCRGSPCARAQYRLRRGGG